MMVETMIANCPSCNRDVANNELIARTKAGWMPTACCNSDGPGVWDALVINHQHFYCSAIDAGRTCFLLGPYETFEEATKNVERARNLACDYDWKAWFYSFGTCSTNAVRKTAFGK